MSPSFSESTARKRVQGLLDAGTFREILGPAQRVTSPHLALLDVPAAFDDGVVVGSGQLAGQAVLIAAQEGAFMGGGVGEVHGAKLVGLFQRAVDQSKSNLRPTAVLLLAESGGVRLHEANAGLIAVSEVMRALLDVRAAGIPVVVLIGGANGCFGGMGLVARCADYIVMSDVARLAMSGPEVIEASQGAEEFDSRDRALVWRTTGGKHRYITGDCDALADDSMAAFRQAAIDSLDSARPLTLDNLEEEHRFLSERLRLDGHSADALPIWARLGVPQPDKVADMEAAELRAWKEAV